MASRSTRRVSFAEPADSGVAAESPLAAADTHAYDPVVHNLPPVATRLPQHPRCQRLRMSRNQTRTKRLMRNPQSRAATPSRSKIIPWKVLPRPRPLAAPHPSHARASPVCTPVTPFLTSALHTAYRSPRRAPRAHTGCLGLYLFSCLGCLRKVGT